MLRLAGDFATTLGQFAFAMAQLFGEPFGDEVDGLVEIMAVILSVQVRSGQRQMDFDAKGVFHGAGFIVEDGTWALLILAA